MSNPLSRTDGPALAATAVLMSLTLQNVGAAAAKTLFPIAGVEGVTALRVGFSALILLAVWRPWRKPVERRAWLSILVYGATLGLMNLLIYKAFARIPIGIAIAIEVTGPLAVAVLGSRRRQDFAWIACAVAGLALLLPLHEASAALDPVGLAFAAGAATCWALYIIFGKRASGSHGGQTVAFGMVVAASFTVPLGIGHAGEALLAPSVMLLGLLVAVFSSTLPYSLEMIALRRLPSHVFGIIVSGSPAIAAVVGVVMLHEQLTTAQWAAIGLIITASAGSALTRGGQNV